jgi:hypothetical protein
MRPTSALAFAVALAAPAAQAAVTYGGITVGSASLDEAGYYGYQGLALSGAPYDLDVCGDTATISVGAEPTVQRMQGDASAYRFFLGWRFDGFAIEAGHYNVARIESHAVVNGYPVVQPSCTSGSETVAADGVKLETLQYRGWFLTPVYIRPLGADLELELRATLASWTRDARSEWQVVATVYDGSDPLASGPVAYDYARIDTEGFDVGFGLGLAWRATESLRLRALIEDQVLGPQRVRATSVGLVVDF